MTATASDPTQWKDELDATPPVQWEAVATDDRWWWDDGGGFDANPGRVIYIGGGLPDLIEIDWEVVNPSAGLGIQLAVYTAAGVLAHAFDLLGAGETGSGTVSFSLSDYPTLAPDDFSFAIVGVSAGYFGRVALLGPADCVVDFNCDCDIDPDARTLEDMRTDTLLLTGYAAQAATPPPGIAAMYDGFINRSQRWVYSKMRAMETRRFFTWQLAEGVRYYGLRSNDDCCTVKLNRYKIEGAWIKDLNDVWWPLAYGIDPTSYTLDRNFGWPTNFEVRQCIEVWPAPQAAYTLRIKGHFQLLPLVEDDDTTTIPSEPVLNYGIYLAKAHKGMADAPVYLKMANDGIADLIAGKHVTRRYVPGASELPIATPPRMVTFQA